MALSQSVLKPLRSSCNSPAPLPSGLAWVAQSVEQRIENPRVGGSIPPPGTTHSQSHAVCAKRGQIGPSKVNLRWPPPRRRPIKPCR